LIVGYCTEVAALVVPEAVVAPRVPNKAIKGSRDCKVTQSSVINMCCNVTSRNRARSFVGPGYKQHGIG